LNEWRGHVLFTPSGITITPDGSSIYVTDDQGSRVEAFHSKLVGGAHALAGVPLGAGPHDRT
jgi:hypothetical protein